jgi:hypothetical protein
MAAFLQTSVREHIPRFYQDGVGMAHFPISQRMKKRAVVAARLGEDFPLELECRSKARFLT